MPEQQCHKIARIDRFGMSNDGSKYVFTFYTDDNLALDVELEAQNLGALIQYLIAAASNMALTIKGGFEKLRTPGVHLPIPTVGVGIAATPKPEMMLLVTRHKTFDLAFEIPTAELEGFAKDVANAAKLMNANPSAKN